MGKIKSNPGTDFDPSQKPAAHTDSSTWGLPAKSNLSQESPPNLFPLWRDHSASGAGSSQVLTGSSVPSAEDWRHIVGERNMSEKETTAALMKNAHSSLKGREPQARAI